LRGRGSVGGSVVLPREKTKMWPLELTATPTASPRWRSAEVSRIGNGTVAYFRDGLLLSEKELVKRKKIAVRKNRIACLRIANVGMSGQTIHLDGESEELKMAISSYIEMEERLLHSRDEALAQWSGGQDAYVTFDRESLYVTSWIFPGNLGALFARFGKPDSDGLLAALYAPALATFAGA